MSALHWMSCTGSGLQNDRICVATSGDLDMNCVSVVEAEALAVGVEDSAFRPCSMPAGPKHTPAQATKMIGQPLTVNRA